MQLAVQPNLVERCVFEAARGDALLRSNYERQFADCHSHRDATRREQAFAELHERWFSELGLRDRIIGIAREFTQLTERVGRLVVVPAPGAAAQSAELLGSVGRYTVVLAVAPATLRDAAVFQYWARHEFLHIEDMLDPAFGYDREFRPAGTTAAAKNLTQDRYAVLWAISVDVRLASRDQAPGDVLSKRAGELARAFGLGAPADGESIIQKLDAQGAWRAPRHETFLDWARHGLSIVEASRRAPNDNGATLRGGSCALCGFSTFEWAGDLTGRDELAQAIREDFPHWSPGEAICARCAEVYEACAAVRLGSRR